MQVKKSILKLGNLSVNALFFLTDKLHSNNSDNFAIFTHGYTSHKADVLNWAHRLSFAGMNTAIFDLPGHYLGSYNKVDDFDEFTENSHLLFLKAAEYLSALTGKSPKKIIFGGHSLGAFFALRAQDIKEFKSLSSYGICVGAMYLKNSEKIFMESDFYHDTLIMREQLIAPCLRSHNFFPWMKQRIDQIHTKNKNIHLITGHNDVMVGERGTQRLFEHLKDLGNMVTLHMPKSLPHHRPELASPFIYSYLKQKKIV